MTNLKAGSSVHNVHNVDTGSKVVGVNILVRGVSEELARACRVRAAEMGMSLPKWVQMVLSNRVEIDAGDEVKESRSVARKRQKVDAGSPATPSEGAPVIPKERARCPLCGKGMLNWGSGHRCEQCKRNFQ